MEPEELRRRRLERRWTQSQVAERLGVSQSFVAQMEAGARPIPDEVSAKLDSILHYWVRKGRLMASAPRGAYRPRS